MAINSWVRQVQEVETQDQSESEVQIQVQCFKWRFKSSIPEFFIFLDSKFSGLKSSWIHIFLNEFSLKKVWIQEDFISKKFQSRKIAIQENVNSRKFEIQENFNSRKWKIQECWIWIWILSPETGSELKIQIDPEFRLPELDELRSSLPSVFVLTVSHVASFLSLYVMYLCRLHSFARFFSRLMCRLCSDFICNGSLKSEPNRSNVPSKIAIFNEPCSYDFSLNALFWRIWKILWMTQIQIRKKYDESFEKLVGYPLGIQYSYMLNMMIENKIYSITLTCKTKWCLKKTFIRTVMMYTIENISKFFMTNKRAAPLGGGSSLLARFLISYYKKMEPKSYHFFILTDDESMTSGTLWPRYN